MQDGFPELLGRLQGLLEQGFRVAAVQGNLAVAWTSQGYHPFLEVLLVRDQRWTYLDTGPA